MDNGAWDEALQLLQTRLTFNPDDARSWARRGECEYRLGQLDAASASLNKSLGLNPSLYTAHLFLGYIAESEGNPDVALWHYQTFLDHRPRAPQARDVAQRIESMRRNRAREFARQALAGEKQLMPGTYSDSTIGVVYFRSTLLPDSLRPLAKGFAAMTVTDLARVKSLRVVERLRTEELLKELRLSASSAFDSASAPRLGKLLGAARLLGGELALLGEQRLRVDPQIVSSKSGDVTLTEPQAGELAEFFSIEKRVVYSILDELGLTPSLAERDSIEILPTHSIDAFMAYSRGLDFEDRGLYAEAHQAFAHAARIDPSFSEARERSTVSQLLIGSKPGAPARLETFAAASSSPTEWSAPRGTTDRRLEALLNNAGLVRVAADEPSTEDDLPYTAPAGGETQVIIKGRFDD